VVKQLSRKVGFFLPFNRKKRLVRPAGGGGAKCARIASPFETTKPNPPCNAEITLSDWPQICQ
jgi:hypothetical protein